MKVNLFESLMNIAGAPGWGFDERDIRYITNYYGDCQVSGLNAVSLLKQTYFDPDLCQFINDDITVVMSNGDFFRPIEGFPYWRGSDRVAAFECDAGKVELVEDLSHLFKDNA